MYIKTLWQESHWLIGCFVQQISWDENCWQINCMLSLSKVHEQNDIKLLYLYVYVQKVLQQNLLKVYV